MRVLIQVFSVMNQALWNILLKKAHQKLVVGILAFLHQWVVVVERIGLGCNPIHTYQGISPIDYNGTYFRVNMQTTRVYNWFFVFFLMISF